ncbi:hypothetical protein DFP72DRAFT_886271 [Ephemerocybe angulata]|uniref:Rhodopsin domain-containing protein n=1 Tax=Ephemerocybe angulata TaxID=980116 RepID=A0A8H6I642_9AGAR|nr:hypothetical protein DFP72DRAFT_886271 [Tulosesus angulatus]
MRKWTPELEYAFEVVISTAYALAVITTCVRLYRRRLVGRLWWDDWLALVSCLGSTWMFVSFWMKDESKGGITPTRGYRKAWFSMSILVSWTTIWLTRMSLALGTARIFPPQHPAHRLTQLAVRAFAFVLVSFLVAFGAQCAPASAWVPPPGVHDTRIMCFTPVSSVYYPAVAGLLADVFLIAVPICALWMLLSAFAASIVITLATIPILVFQAVPETWEPMKSEMRFRIGWLETATSVVVCNLIVIASYVFRLLHGPSIRGGPSSATAESYSLESRNQDGVSRSSSGSILSFTDISSPEVDSEDHRRTMSFGIGYIENWDDYNPDTMQSGYR